MKHDTVQESLTDQTIDNTALAGFCYQLPTSLYSSNLIHLFYTLRMNNCLNPRSQIALDSETSTIAGQLSQSKSPALTATSPMLQASLAKPTHGKCAHTMSAQCLVQQTHQCQTP